MHYGPDQALRCRGLCENSHCLTAADHEHLDPLYGHRGHFVSLSAERFEIQHLPYSTASEKWPQWAWKRGYRPDRRIAAVALLPLQRHQVVLERQLLLAPCQSCYAMCPEQAGGRLELQVPRQRRP